MNRQTAMTQSEEEKKISLAVSHRRTTMKIPIPGLLKTNERLMDFFSV